LGGDTTRGKGICAAGEGFSGKLPERKGFGGEIIHQGFFRRKLRVRAVDWHGATSYETRVRGQTRLVMGDV
jgi:hypothetical protein